MHKTTTKLKEWFISWLPAWAVKRPGVKDPRTMFANWEKYSDKDPKKRKPWAFFSNDPEMLRLLLGSPVNHVKRKAIAPVEKDGTALEELQEVFIDENGRTVRKTTFTTVDDTGVIGAANQLSGFCSECNALVFKRMYCDACGRSFCTMHLKPFQDAHGRKMLCATDYKKAKWASDNWNEPASPDKKEENNGS